MKLKLIKEEGELSKQKKSKKTLASSLVSVIHCNFSPPSLSINYTAIDAKCIL